MTDQEFCKIETAISGEEIDKVEQLTHCTFTGRELKEYLEQAFVIYGVSIRFSRKMYDKRRLAPLYFTVDYTVNNSVLYLKGEEYSPYNWNYDRMTRYMRNGVLSENVC